MILLLVMLVPRCYMPLLCSWCGSPMPHCTGNKCTFECDTWTQYRILVMFVREGKTVASFAGADPNRYHDLEQSAPRLETYLLPPDAAQRIKTRAASVQLES